MVHIRIQPHGLLLTAHGPARLLDLVDERGISSVPLSCRGARCGVCRVRVARGSGCFEPAGRLERELLGLQNAGADERLGCQLWLRAGAEGNAELCLLSEVADG